MERADSAGATFVFVVVAAVVLVVFFAVGTFCEIAWNTGNLLFIIVAFAAADIAAAAVDLVLVAVDETFVAVETFVVAAVDNTEAALYCRAGLAFQKKQDVASHFFAFVQQIY